MKGKYRFRFINDVDRDKIMMANVCGSSRGFSGGVMAIECTSNEISMCIRTFPNFTLVVEPIKNTKDMENQERKYRIRKLTERECYRLMDVEEEDIDILLSKKTIIKKDGTQEEKLVIPSSQHYKLAGNSIVVNCMYHIFKNIFYPEDEKMAEGTQLSLF